MRDPDGVSGQAVQLVKVRTRGEPKAAEGGRWVDVVWWRSMEDAKAAAERAMTSESCAPMFALIDMTSTLMLHGEHVAA